MAAGGKYDVALSNGQTLSIWQLASQAVNSSPGCTLQGAAAATTLTTDQNKLRLDWVDISA